MSLMSLSLKPEPSFSSMQKAENHVISLASFISCFIIKSLYPTRGLLSYETSEPRCAPTATKIVSF